MSFKHQQLYHLLFHEQTFTSHIFTFFCIMYDYAFRKKYMYEWHAFICDYAFIYDYYINIYIYKYI